MRKHYHILGLIILLIAGIATGSPSDETIKVGVYNNPPKIFVDSTGNPQGLFIDILKEIAREEDWELEFIDNTWENHLIDLQRGAIHILPDVAKTENRSHQYRFNNIPVIESWLQFFSLGNSPITNTSDLDEKSIAVLEGSVQHDYLLHEFAQQFTIQYTIIPFQNYPQALQLLETGKADAILADRFFYFYARHLEKTKAHPIIINPTSLHFAFSPGTRPSIIAQLDEHLVELINNPQSAYYTSLNEWLQKPSPANNTLPGKILNLFFIVGLAGLGWFAFQLQKRLKARSKELKFRSGILESANRMLEELLEERRLNEIALKESEEAFKSLFLQSTDPILLIRNDKIFDCNPATLRFLQFTSTEQIVGKTPWEISPPFQNDGEPSHKKALRMISETLSQGHNRFDWTHCRADGSEIMLEVVLTAIVFKGSKTIHVSWRDITEHRKAEQSLRLSEERYRMLVDNQTDLVVKVDNEGRFMYVSPSYCSIFGKTMEELVGNRFLPLVHPDDQKATEEAMKQLYAEPFVCALEQRALTVNGWRWFSWVDTAIRNEKGEVVEILGVGRDITDSVAARNELINQKTFIQTVLDNLPIGVAINEFDSGKASYLNKKFAEIYGWPVEELSDIPRFFELVYPDEKYRKEISERILSDIRSGDPERMRWHDISITTQTGEKRIVSASNIPLADQNMMVSTVIDNTDEWMSKKEIKKQRDNLQMMLSIAAKIGESDSLEDILYYTIERICTDTGWDIGEAWIPSEDMTEMIYSGASFTSQPGLNPFLEASTHFRFGFGAGIPGKVWKNKAPVWVKDLSKDDNFLRKEEAGYFSIYTGVGIPILANESVVSILIFFKCEMLEEDKNLLELVSAIGLQLGELFRRKAIVEQQEKTLKMLHISEQQLLQAQKIGNIGSWELNFNTGTVIASEQARKIYGVEHRELPIRYIQALVEEPYRSILDQAFLQHKEHETPYDVVFQIKRPSDGSLRFIHSVAEYSTVENKLVGIIHDITETKTNERLRQEIMVANESARFKQNFLAQMSHEIRTPLTAIEGMIDIIEKTELLQNQKEFFDTIKFSSDNLKNIINEVLDYSRIEAGGISLHPVDFSVEEIFVRSRQLFDSLNKSESKFIEKGMENVPKFLHADKHRIFQIITNFISNALKYAQGGIIALEIEPLDEVATQIQKFRITLHDQGKGISNTLKQKLFKPFSQIHKEQEIPIEGTGLGLSICKELALLLGGSIGVDSEPGKGSSFWFTFNAGLVDQPIFEPIGKIISTQEKGPHKRKLKILLAEDKQVNQKVITLILSSLGHTITVASNGQEVVDTFSEGQFDLVLMDIQMPVMDGITATNLIRKNYPTNKTPIVGLSANALSGDREHYINQGLDDYITKPVRSDDFNQLIIRLGL